MTLTHKRLSIVIAAAIALVIVLPLAATAAGPAYDGAEPAVEYEAASPGTGTAVATVLPLDPSAGTVGVAANTTETSPIGLAGSMIGTDTAVAKGQLIDFIDAAAPGKYTITVSMDVTDLSASKTIEGVPGFANAATQVLAIAGFGAGSSEAKATELNGITCPALPCTITLTGLVDVFDASSVQDIKVNAGLQALAYSQGQGSATALAAATVTDITAAPAGEVPPPPPPVQNLIEVVRDTVAVDSRSPDLAMSHINLADGISYILEVRGTYDYTLNGTEHADARCNTYLADQTYRDTRPELSASDLELFVNGVVAAWSPAAGTAQEANPADPNVSACSTSHVYRLPVTGDGNAWSFLINDPGRLDNVGTLTVNIIELVPSPA